MTEQSSSNQRGSFILILIAMIMGTLIGLMFGNNPSFNKRSEHKLHYKLDEVLHIIETEYVDPVDSDSLYERITATILSELDPHSAYMSNKAVEQTAEHMRGSFEGVGIVLHREGDTSYVGQLIAGGPSERTGILPGDMILTVNGDTVSGVNMPADSVVARLRGQRYSEAKVEVIRQQNTSHPTHHTFTIRRNTVPRNSVSYFGMLSQHTGYIALSSFTNTSNDEFHQALLSLKHKGATHMVVDLRGNGGGSLTSAIDIANEFLPAGRTIVYTEGCHDRRHTTTARRGGLFTEGEVTVMVDESSASASEVVAGALQDNDRATIVGRRTFGKGLVQREFVLADQSAIMLTVARYYTPSGRCIQRPYTNGADEYYRQYLSQVLDEVYSGDSINHIQDSTPYHTIGGRTVYGGGGIIPDRTLAYHRDENIGYYNRLRAKSIIANTAFDYVKTHAETLLKNYPDAQSFTTRFQVPQTMIDKMVECGERMGVARDDKGLSEHKHLFEAMLKAHIGSSLYGNDGFYLTSLQFDDDIKQLNITK